MRNTHVFPSILLVLSCLQLVAFGQATPSCVTTSSSWTATGASYGAATIHIAGWSGSTLNDYGIQSAVNTSTGYLDRTTTIAALDLRQGDSYTISWTKGTTSNHQIAQAWIDFNDDGVFAVSEEVTGVWGWRYSTPPIVADTTLTIPVTGTPGNHRMRVRCLWEYNATDLGYPPAHVDPCNISYSGISLQYWSGTCVDYKVNIISTGPWASTTPTSLGFGITATSTCSSPLTFSLNAGYLAPDSGNLVITPPSSFQVSIDSGATWSSSATNLAYSGSTVSPTTIQVRFCPTSVGAYSGNVTITGGGLSSAVNVAVTGTGIAPCTGTPTAGTTVASPTSGSASTVIALSLSGATVAGGISYQWQYSPDLTTWSTLAGATSATYSYTGLTANTYFRAVLTCPSYTPAGSLPALVTYVVPTIIVTAISPQKGNPGSSVTITGDGFNTTAANNIVYFGATRATVTAASATSLMVNVPGGATYFPVTVNNNAFALTGYSPYPFLPTYDNSAYVAGAIGFSPRVEFATASGAYMEAIGDLDGDGKPDLVVSKYGTTSGGILVYRNTSTAGSITPGSFAAKVEFPGSSPVGIAIGDLDGDGKPDIAVANSNSSTVSVFRNTSTPGSIDSSSFAAKVDFATGGDPYSVAIGDLDGDGKPDIAVANDSSSTVSVLRNTSTAGSITTSSFAAKVDFVTGSHPINIAIGNLDADSKPELVVANRYSATVSVFRNTSTAGSINSGSFAPKVDFATGNLPLCVAIGDLDGDGKSDLAVANLSSMSVSVLRNTGASDSIVSASFATKVDFAMSSGAQNLAIGDLDGDGKPDLAVVSQGVATVSVFRNTSTSGSITSGSFAAKVDFVTAASPVSISIGDLNSDGRPDLAVSSYNYPVSVFENNPLGAVGTLPAITGPTSVCVGATITVANDTAGGTWSSGNTSVATVGSTGVVTGVAAGTAVISYTKTGSFGTLVATHAITVNTLPSAGTVSGASTVAIGGTTTMSPSVSGGTWSASNSNAMVNSAGVVTGVAAGIVTISYTVTNSCGTAVATRTLTVTAAVAGITGTLSLCVGTNSALSCATPGGTWSSGNTAVATVSTSAVVTGVATGTATITYMTPAGYATAVVTVVAAPAAIGGPAFGCVGGNITLTDAVPGGVWSSASPAVATVNPATGIVTGIAYGNATISYSMGAGCYKTKSIAINNGPAITGERIACVGLTTTLAGGYGTWTSGNPSVAAITISGGYVTGVSAGTANITFTLTSTTCPAVTVVTVIPVPAAITGPATACQGSVVTLSDVSPGGSWSCSNTAVATIGSATGIVTAVGSGGSATISYSFGSNCRAMLTFSPKAVPAVIGGTPSICTPATTTLTDVTAAGTWSSSNTSVATTGTAINAGTGIITGVSAGTTNISYTITATGCARSVVVTVNAGPNAGTISSSGGFTLHTISAPTSVTLSSTGAPGGTWTSSNPAVATVNSSSGVVVAAAAGTTTITYTVTGACTNIATRVITVTAGRAIGNQQSPIGGVRLYPNPTTGAFTLVSDESGTLRVYSIDGRAITGYEVKAGINDLHLPGELAPGVYMCRYTSESGGTTMVRLVVER